MRERQTDGQARPRGSQRGLGGMDLAVRVVYLGPKDSKMSPPP